jgi:hypothetical protein
VGTRMTVTLPTAALPQPAEQATPGSGSPAED